MNRFALATAVVTLACGHRSISSTDSDHLFGSIPQTQTERMVALLPEGAQIVIELDLARLRANPLGGDIAARALNQNSELSSRLSVAERALPLASSDAVVFAAYGVGTAAAATIGLVATTEELTGAIRIAPDLVAIGPDAWTRAFVANRANAAPHLNRSTGTLHQLRAMAEPKGSTGAVLRIVAQLPFDARIAFARLIGFEAPAQVSVWADIADDAVVVLDSDATDPGSASASDSGRRFAATLRNALQALADLPTMRALGLTGSLRNARVAVRGAWVRVVIVIGPRHLARVIERARAMLPPRYEAH